MSQEAKAVKVVVAAVNANGEPDLFFTEVNVTPEMLSNGDHYELAKDVAIDEGYEEPMLAFDASDSAAHRLIKAVEWFAK